MDMREFLEAFRKILIELLVPEIKALRDEMHALREESNQRFEAMQERMDKRFEAMQNQMDQRFEALTREMNRRFEAANDRFASLEKSLAVVIAQGEAHQRLTQNVLDRLDVRERVATLETQVATLFERIPA